MTYTDLMHSKMVVERSIWKCINKGKVNGCIFPLCFEDFLFVYCSGWPLYKLTRKKIMGFSVIFTNQIIIARLQYQLTGNVSRLS